MLARTGEVQPVLGKNKYIFPGKLDLAGVGGLVSQVLHPYAARRAALRYFTNLHFRKS